MIDDDIRTPVIRRAILDLLTDIGGEHNDDELAMLLAQLGHTRVSRRDVRAHVGWLTGERLVDSQMLGSYLVASVNGDGRDVAAGRLTIAGISPHKTGR